MPHEKTTYSSRGYEATASEVRSSGSTTFRGEQRVREGKPLDPLVDPRTHGSARQALNLLVPQADGRFLLEYGVAIPVKTSLDCTGSMGGNVDIAFRAVPRTQEYLVDGQAPLLKGYHVQKAMAAIQDVTDREPHQHSEFEPDNEHERQMTLFDREKAGGDATEDYQMDLWYTAQRIETSIVRYGLRGYYFIVGDERGRQIMTRALTRKFYQIDLQSDIPVVELGPQVLANWHAFYLQVGDLLEATQYWTPVLGRERAVILPRTEDLPEIQAVIIGLTEGALDLQNATEFLAEHGVDRQSANRIVRAVSHIPLRAQAELPNFGKLPQVGSVFASRDDLWPIGYTNPSVEPPSVGSINWQL